MSNKDVTEIKGIGEKIGERLNERGYVSPMEIANQEPIKLAKIGGIGEEVAHEIVEKARDMVYDDYLFHEQYDPVSDKVVEVEKDSHGCKYCGKHFREISVWRTHMNNCDDNPVNK